MKFLFDYFPIICFFIAYKFFGIYIATAVTMVASALQLITYRLIHHRFESLHLITFGLIMILGGSTLMFHKIIFIKWKPSLIYWIFSIVLCGSHFYSKQPLLQTMLGNKITLPSYIWVRLNFIWSLFFLFLGLLNLYIIYHFDTNTWVYFKLFGTLAITLIFIIGQAVYMAHHMSSSQSPSDLQKK